MVSTWETVFAALLLVAVLVWVGWGFVAARTVADCGATAPVTMTPNPHPGSPHRCQYKAPGHARHICRCGHQWT